MSTLLSTEGLTVRYGGVLANDDVSLTVGEGEVVGLIGPNGAGKTSLVDAVTGFTPAGGTVSLAGRRIDRLAPHERRRAGLARTWQAGELFADLTVRQNVGVATGPGPLRNLWADLTGRRRPGRDVDEVLELFGLHFVADRRPGELSLGRQKIAGVARALVGGTRVVLLDEPAAGLDTDESAEFGRHVRAVAATGLAVLLIDHDMTLVADVCDRAYVLDYGVVIAEGTPQAVLADPAVRRAYLGSELAP
ncbi:ABC transporter ATP-binding protein [Dactylosporangium sp. AC04546]|uniref:ABC transporter ATP-binding protein n=1 Tax=Dactylosporangium sp. AC04546 TaxID=2862460 RepID=UPI001EDF5BD8|nr:ABC transporter ATP-binding protein [Dactylosporangium sp. AC04546]WVK79008.1 ABC transporter ATP-binding protein [Dactylosporangium sp. AC04546]